PTLPPSAHRRAPEGNLVTAVVGQVFQPHPTPRVPVPDRPAAAADGVGEPPSLADVRPGQTVLTPPPAAVADPEAAGARDGGPREPPQPPDEADGRRTGPPGR